MVVVSVHVALGVLVNVDAVDRLKLDCALAVQVCAPQLRVEIYELAPFKLLVFLPRAGSESAMEASAGLQFRVFIYLCVSVREHHLVFLPLS